MCDYVSKTFGITRERFECKFSYNPPVNMTKIRTGSDFWSDRERICGASVRLRKWREKIRKSITTTSLAKYNFVASGDGVTTAVTLLLSRIHNKLISRRASYENIRKVFSVYMYSKSAMTSRWREKSEGAESGKTSIKIKRTTIYSAMSHHGHRKLHDY